jgi:SHS2 domain-containing protein
MTLEQLASLCRGEVTLTINQHKSSYHSVEDEVLRYCDINDMTPNTLKRMREANTMYELQFYLTSPLSSYIVYGTSLDEVLQEAEVLINSLQGKGEWS